LIYGTLEFEMLREEYFDWWFNAIYNELIFLSVRSLILWPQHATRALKRVCYDAGWLWQTVLGALRVPDSDEQ
jgi:hypothetical protein